MIIKLVIYLIIRLKYFNSNISSNHRDSRSKNIFIANSYLKMTQNIKKNSEYLNPKVDKFLQNVTNYVSKPLGFDKIYSEDQLRKKGNKSIS